VEREGRKAMGEKKQKERKIGSDRRPFKHIHVKIAAIQAV
jgi:hypothetical protein